MRSPHELCFKLTPAVWLLAINHHWPFRIVSTAYFLYTHQQTRFRTNQVFTLLSHSFPLNTQLLNSFPSLPSVQGHHKETMAIRFPSVLSKQSLRRSKAAANKAASSSLDVPKGYLAVYVGESEKKRYLVPVSYLNQPLFQDLLRKAEEEFGFDHPMGGLTIPCSENAFFETTSSLSGS